MFLATTPDMGEIMAEGIQEGMEMGFQILWDAIKQCAAEYPLITGVIVFLVLFNFVYPIYKKRKKK